MFTHAWEKLVWALLSSSELCLQTKVNAADVGLSLHMSTLSVFRPESKVSHLGRLSDVPSLDQVLC